MESKNNNLLIIILIVIILCLTGALIFVLYNKPYCKSEIPEVTCDYNKDTCENIISNDTCDCNNDDNEVKILSATLYEWDFGENHNMEEYKTKIVNKVDKSSVNFSTLSSIFVDENKVESEGLGGMFMPYIELEYSDNTKKNITIFDDHLVCDSDICYKTDVNIYNLFK